MKNRLNLNFNLNSQEERTEFVTSYVQTLSPPPTIEETEKIANYILDGSYASEKDYVVAHKNSTWTQKEPESLEGLQEQECFSEELIHPLNSTHYIVRPTKFSRAEARKNLDLAAQLDPLWRRIDHLDLLICYYDLHHNRRVKPPRPELLARFTPEQQAAIEEESTHLNQFQYLKKRHLIVDLRRDQYSIADQFKNSMVLPHKPISIEERVAEMPQFLPLGLCEGDRISPIVFQPFSQLNPAQFKHFDLNLISKFLWSAPSTLCVDLRDINVITELILDYLELQEDETFTSLLKTLDYYITESNFEPLYQDILSKKIQHIRNQDIALYINKTYKKSYTTNYISTIFHKKLMPELVETIIQHRTIIENLFFNENFKKCNTCGRVLLLNDYNFVKKTRSSDGYTNRCKCCDKTARRKAK